MRVLGLATQRGGKRRPNDAAHPHAPHTQSDADDAGAPVAKEDAALQEQVECCHVNDAEEEPERLLWSRGRGVDGAPAIGEESGNWFEPNWRAEREADFLGPGWR